MVTAKLRDGPGLKQIQYTLEGLDYANIISIGKSCELCPEPVTALLEIIDNPSNEGFHSLCARHKTAVEESLSVFLNEEE